jgi:hypothetical protein
VRRSHFAWVGLAAVYVGLAAVVPPADDELYYWCWADPLQWSYYDHPPMTAYLIRLSTTLFGNSLVATRLPAAFCILGVLAVIARLMPDRSLLPWVVLTPLFTFGAVLITPDAPLLLFWALYLAWLVAVHRRLGPESCEPVPVWLWALGGVLLGCGILSKYTMGLALPAGGLGFLLVKRWRRWMPGYAFHLAVAFVVTLPILIHNIRHDFAPLRYQWRHTMQTSAPGLLPFGAFTGTQVLLFGLLPLVLLPWVLRNARRLTADPALRPCVCLYAFPMLFFLYKAARGPLEGNWALVSYIGFWPLAAVWFAEVRERVWLRRFAAASFAVPLGCVLLIGVHLVKPVGLIPPVNDRITRQTEKYAIARGVESAFQSQAEPLPVYTPSYQWAAMLRFRSVPADQIPDVTRPSHFTQRPTYPTEGRILVFSEGVLAARFLPGYGPPEIVQNYPLVVRGRLITAYQLLRYEKQPLPEVASR